MASVLSSALRRDSLDFRNNGAVRCTLAVSNDNKASFSGIAGARVTLAGIANPTADNEAATKYYVDTVAAGLTVKGSVQYTTAANIDATYAQDRMSLAVTGSAFGAMIASTFDINAQAGETLEQKSAAAPMVADASEDVATRFLVKNQTDKTQNGVYFLESTASTGWTLRRCANFNDDPSGEIKSGSFVFVTSGYVHANHGFVLVSDAGVKVLRVNGDAPNELQFEQFSGAGQLTAGTNMNKTGDTINLDANITVTDVHTTTLTANGHSEFNSTVHADGAASLGSTLAVTGAITAAAQGHQLATFAVDNGSIVSSSGALSIGSNSFTMGGLATFNGACNLESNLSVTGATTLKDPVTMNKTVLAKGAVTMETTLAVTGATTLSSTLAVTGAATVTGATALQSTLDVTGASVLSSTLAVTGATTVTGATALQSTLDVTGATVLSSTLAVTGAATVTGATALQSTLDVTGATVLSSTLGVTGAATVTGATALQSTLAVTGAITAAAQNHQIADFAINDGSIVSASGALTIGSNSLDVGGAATLGSTLAVTGAAALSSTLSVADSADLATEIFVHCSAATHPDSSYLPADPTSSVSCKATIDGSAYVSGIMHVQSEVRTNQSSSANINVSNVNGAYQGGKNITVLATESAFSPFAVTDTNTTNVSAAESWAVNIGASTQAFTVDAVQTTFNAAVAYGAGSVITASAEGHQLADFTVTNGSIVSASGAVSIGSNTFGTTGAATFGSTVGVTGVITAQAVGHQLADFTVNNGSIVSSSGALSIGSNSLTAGGATTLQSTLAVTGAITAAAQNHQLADFTINNGSIVSASATISHGSNHVTTTGDISSTNMSFTTLLSGATATFSSDCTAQNFYATSDVNLKCEIKPIEGAVAQCQKLRGVEFKWKNGDDQRDQLGVIAQEVEEVYPTLVAEIDGFKRVDYSKLVGLLIEAVKELKAETSQLKAEIAELRA